MPWFDSEFGDDTLYGATTLTHEEDFTPSTSLLWGEDMLFYDNISNTSTSRQLEFDDKDPKIERIRRNMA